MQIISEIATILQSEVGLVKGTDFFNASVFPEIAECTIISDTATVGVGSEVIHTRFTIFTRSSTRKTARVKIDSIVKKLFKREDEVTDSFRINYIRLDTGPALYQDNVNLFGERLHTYFVNFSVFYEDK